MIKLVKILSTPLLLIAALLLCSGQISAHEMRPAALNITETSQGIFAVTWKVPAKDNRRLALAVLLDGSPAFKVQDGRFIDGSHIRTGSIQRAEGLVGATISIDGLDATFTDVLLRLESLDGSIISQRLSPEKPHYRFDPQASGLSLMQTYTEYGVQHILLGTDHLLFVACIVIIAGFSRRLFWAISGFTLAHSVTLGLAALDIIRLPIPAVEAVIALSIVFLAVEIAKHKQDSLTWRYPVIVSSGFGLLHGFAFAAVLAEIGLPKTEGLTALLCFNLGVEIGQLMFIAVLLAGFRLAYKMKDKIAMPCWWQWQKISSYMIGSLSFMWMIERIVAF